VGSFTSYILRTGRWQRDQKNWDGKGARGSINPAAIKAAANFMVCPTNESPGTRQRKRKKLKKFNFIKKK